MKIRGMIVAAVLMLGGVAGGGCQSVLGTSEGFKVAANQAGPFVANVTRQYAEKDAVISVDAKSTILADAAKLGEVTGDRAAVDFDTVEPAWLKVRDVFISYTNADTTLDAVDLPGYPSRRTVMQMPAKKMDEALAAERIRRGKWVFAGQ